MKEGAHWIKYMCLQFAKMLIGLQKYWSIHKIKILAS